MEGQAVVGWVAIGLSAYILTSFRPNFFHISYAIEKYQLAINIESVNGSHVC